MMTFDDIDARAHDRILMQAIREVVPPCEGLDWDAIVAPKRLRPCTDARKRIIAAYANFCQQFDASLLAEALHRDRTTIIYSLHQHHAFLLDAAYRRRYAEEEKAIRERLAQLISIHNHNQKPKEMFTSTICGNLGRNAEVVTIREKSYFKMSVALGGKSKDTPTTWVQVLYFKSANSRLAEFLLSGASIVAQGRTEVSTYKHKDGTQGVDITIWADTLELTKRPAAAASPAQEQESPAAGNDFDDYNF